MLEPLPPHPAALIRTSKTRIMVISDLHIGWEMALSYKGIHVPTQMPKLLRKLRGLVSVYKPEKLLILGDVKYSIAAADLGEWHDIPDFFSSIKEQIEEICVVRGNHDGGLEPLLPESVKILPSTGVVFGNVGLFHGHRWPSPALLECKTLVMGHVHPVVVFRDPAGFRITRQVWVKANCNRSQLTQILLRKHNVRIGKNPGETLWKHYRIKSKTSQLFIMPSFNEFLGGKPLNEPAPSRTAKTGRIVGPVLRSDAVDMENADAYLLDGTLLGTLKQLGTLS